MQSALASLGCTSLSGLVCHTHTHAILTEKQQTSKAYAYFPRSLFRHCWDLQQCQKWCCIKNSSIFLLHAFCNVTLMMLYYRSNICYSKQTQQWASAGTALSTEQAQLSNWIHFQDQTAIEAWKDVLLYLKLGLTAKVRVHAANSSVNHMPECRGTSIFYDGIRRKPTAISNTFSYISGRSQPVLQTVNQVDEPLIYVPSLP